MENTMNSSNMNNEFKLIFDNSEIHITFDSNNVAWFKAYEIAKVLGYNKVNDMIRRLPDNEVQIVPKLSVNLTLNSTEGNPNIAIINEYGLYRIIMRAHYKSNPKIAGFQNWVFYNVLPSIRRFGAYITPEVRGQLANNPDLINDLTSKITDYENRINTLQNDLYEEQHKLDIVRPDGKRTLYMVLDDDNNIAVSIIKNKIKENDKLRSNIDNLNNTINAMIGDNAYIDICTLAKLI